MSVLSCPVHHIHHNNHDQHDNHDRGDHDDNGDMRKLEVIWGIWRLYTRKLKVVHKEVRGCLISYNLQQGSWRLYQSELIIMSDWLSHSVPHVGIKLLWQLKRKAFWLMTAMKGKRRAATMTKMMRTGVVVYMFSWYFLVGFVWIVGLWYVVGRCIRDANRPRWPWLMSSGPHNVSLATLQRLQLLRFCTRYAQIR